MKAGTKVIEVEGYFADDGEFFTDKDECEDYEMQSLAEKIFDITFNSKFKKAKNIDDILYFIPKTKEDIDLFLTINNYYGYVVEGISLDSTISIYKYDTTRNIYIDILQQHRELTVEINSLVPDVIPENIS